MFFPNIGDHVAMREQNDPLNAKVKFDTQSQIFDEMSKQSIAMRFLPPLGFCSAFSNMCAESRMKGEMPKFLEESTYKEIYKSAASVDKLQKRLGQEGDSLAFLDKKHEVKVYDAAPKTPSGEVDKEGVLHQMGKFNLVTYPLSRLSKHQIYFEKEGNGLCKLFNADEPGGLRTAPCHELIDSLGQSMFYYLDKFGIYDKEARVTVVSTNGEPK